MTVSPREPTRPRGAATGRTRRPDAVRPVPVPAPRPGTPADRRAGHRATAELLRRAAHGDRTAWQHVVERYGPLVWSVVHGFRLPEAQAADAVQTTWLRLFEHAGAIREPERLPGWLRTTARRACLEGIGRARREQPWNPHGRQGLGRERACERIDGDPEASLLRREQLASVRSAVRELPERSQRLLELLVASPPLSYEEIGGRLGMPVGSIGPTRARLLARLRTDLAAAGLTDAA
ncbi:RNA polymerase sigma factor [Geodermatophilus marinus]|uniref:RNA polymerase sigma factor n=1 Tax=Geodermatophilus sp. LHW52908 TaxID=2303986 RepID=UPI000E3CCF58|nr:sigma-70 family RNA polymerase sigma factor [Geodermatophilus sp. LHW52908]RFU22489.1 sigma-70 family RNA polymerase sigma factor [Geodermatophilus sp. LHW52908]